MSEYFGTEVSRVLDATSTQFENIISEEGKPLCDAELNLKDSIAAGAIKSANLRGMPSGWLGNETNLQAIFATDPSYSNYFKFGPHRTGEQNSVVFANVGGNLIPVAGTRTGNPPGTPSTETTNVVALDPPPSASGDFRIDFAYLEVWKARIQPNPSTTNKPAASGIWKLGNVEGGFAFLSDDLIDPAIGFETSQRTQIQYRIRVVKGLIGLTSNPDGFDPVVVKAQGAATAPTSYTFTNMRQVLGDAGLWRAGDGTQNALGTVDGYVYAIPIAAIFRRNSVSWNGSPSQNLNGGFNRNPTAVDRTGIATFSTVPTLAADMSASATSIALTSVANIPLPVNPATPVLIQIGDELMTYSSITGSTLNIAARGQNGTRAELHKAGSIVKVMSGRPDGLFSDQIALTDILDLRHVVNPNGFDYDALLKGNLDKLLKGQLRANWKRSGAGPQGPYVIYQDAITASAVALGVTKLDAPDNIRMVFSDAAVVQPIECIVKPHGSTVTPPGTADINVGWSLGFTVKTTNQVTGDVFASGDVISVPVSNLQHGLPGGDTDQVRWLNDSVVGAVSLRFDGETDPIPPTMYTVTPAVPTPSDDLVITFGGTFPTQTSLTATPTILHITLHAVYGAGRGLSRRPNSLHSVSYINPSAELLVQQSGIPSSNQGSRVSWAPLWSKFRSAAFNNLLPVTSEVYADLGSKSIILTPFRRINFPNDAGIGLLTIDGMAANPYTAVKAGAPTTGTIGTDNSPVITVGSVGTTALRDAVVITSGPGAGRYTVIGITPSTSITVDRPIKAKGSTSVTFAVHQAQGVMPLNERDGTTAKWTTTDPLGLFCGTTASNDAYSSIYVSLPRHLVPGWGELRLPILPNDVGSVFSQGINFVTDSKSGSSYGDADKNYVNYNPSSVRTYAAFTTIDPTTALPAIYNAALTIYSNNYAGMRFFTDTRSLGRQGLELPPFYGVARLFAVYEATNYFTTSGPNGGSAFDAGTRAPITGGATNLLRQNMTQSDGPVMWIEIDDDGDSTFILNANAIDIARSPNPIASFASGNYVIEASIFGFDRGTFDLNSEARLVMTQPSGVLSNSWSSVKGGPVDQTSITGRHNNINKYVAGPSAVLPGPAQSSDQVVINHSRSSYQGDAWGSQTSYADTGYKPGPLLSGDAYQLSHTQLNQAALTRPNQKVVEVLASTSFATTLGTGRFAGDGSISPLHFMDVAFADPTNYPPAHSYDDRPLSLPNTFSSYNLTDIGTEYHGSDVLPLGALFRDSDLKGQLFGITQSPLVFSNDVAAGHSTGLAVNHMEQDEMPLDTASSGVVSPGDVLVHVDGEQGNYSLLTNFRVNRGGSVFVGNGPHPGGEISLQGQSLLPSDNHTNVLMGRAMLVRNAPTNVGATEVSAGDELMMLVITNVVRPTVGTPIPGDIAIGTNGKNEGYSAADLARIEGHPLVRNNVRLTIDPSTITLSKRS